MATCKKCNQSGLEWIEDDAKWRLYDPKTGRWHNADCPSRFGPVKGVKMVKKHASVCSHGILLTSACPLCEDERNNEDNAS
jgi:hypothetical protein